MNLNLNEKNRRQFDLAPYPNLPATQMGGDGEQGLILHSFVSAWYTKTQRVWDLQDLTQDITILDIGCSSGGTG